MTVAEVLARIEKTRRAGAGHVGRCPAHEDKQASLSIREGDDGRVLLNCHAGCEFKAIVSALGLRATDLFPPRERVKATVVARYDYTDQRGKLLYQVERLEPKGFRQRRPDGRGWAYRLDGVKRVPYHLPLLQTDLARAVFIAEGEKDVDLLVALGFVATCNAGGADDGSGSKWRSEFAGALIGRHAWLLEDNDAAGRRHVAHVARTLRAKAASIRLITFRDMPEHSDVSDWLQRELVDVNMVVGGAASMIRQLARDAPPWCWDRREDVLRELLRHHDAGTTPGAGVWGDARLALEGDSEL